MFLHTQDKLGKNGMEDLYQILGVKPSATSQEIKARFRYLAQAYHPDKFVGGQNKERAEEDFKRISVAYQVLSNPEKRAFYDAERLISKKHYQQRTKKGQRDSQTIVPSRVSSQKLKRRRKKTFLFLWIVILVLVCGIISLCIIGSMLFNNNSPSSTDILRTTNTSVPYKTATPRLSEKIVRTITKVPTEVPASLTPLPTPQAIGESIIIAEKYNDAVWEISVEKIIFSNSLTSPLTGSVDRASGRFAIIFLSVTNRGLSTRSFVTTTGFLNIYDAEGHVYEEHIASMSAREIYNIDSGLNINPDSTAHIISVFDISASSDFYIFKPASLVESNSSGLYLDIP